MHYKQQEELARLEKKIGDQASETQQLVQAVGQLSTLIDRQRAATDSAAAESRQLGRKLQNVSNVVDEQQATLTRVWEHLARTPAQTDEKDLEKPEPAPVAGKRPIGRGGTSSLNLADFRAELGGSFPAVSRRIAFKRSSATGLSELETVRLEVTGIIAKEINALQMKLNEDIAGLVRMIGDSSPVPKCTEQSNPGQFHFLQRHLRLSGLSNALFVFSILQLPQDRREKVKATIAEQKQELEKQFQPALLEDPLSEVLAEVDQAFSGKPGKFGKLFKHHA
mmetsp:Transcript_73424/g.170325  ORF Transcript_73424/g.170325 Transcript_73424/m.170325 type:complete len:280 (-) Transcript_73424:180-1019(-)